MINRTFYSILILFTFISSHLVAQSSLPTDIYGYVRIGGSTGMFGYGSSGPYNGQKGNANGGFSYDFGAGYYFKGNFGIGASFNSFNHSNEISSYNKIEYNGANTIITQEGASDWNGYSLFLNPRYRLGNEKVQFGLVGYLGMTSIESPSYVYQRSEGSSTEQRVLEKGESKGIAYGGGLELKILFNQYIALNGSLYTIASNQEFIQTETINENNGSTINASVTDLKRNMTPIMMNFQIGLVCLINPNG